MLKKLFLYIIVSVSIVSCQEEGASDKTYKQTLPSSTGGRLDVLVIAEENIWRDIPGETFRRYFTEAQVGLPQAEPIFNVRQVNPSQLSPILRRARNLVMLKTGEENFAIQQNRHAHPQVVVHLSAPDSFALAKLVALHQEEIISFLHKREVQHLQRKLVKNAQRVHPVLKEHHVKMEIPKDFELENTGENLLVYWKKGLRSDQGIIIHFEPLDENDALIGTRIIPLRDSLTRLYVPGEREGSYMKVEDYIPPIFENTEIDGHFAIETRGLWRTEGDFMGGPFINYSIFDEINNQRIMLDGFVFAPELDKRDILLELEAILKTLETIN